MKNINPSNCNQRISPPQPIDACKTACPKDPISERVANVLETASYLNVSVATIQGRISGGHHCNGDTPCPDKDLESMLTAIESVLNDIRHITNEILSEL